MLWRNTYQSAAEYSAEVAMKGAVTKRDGLGFRRVLSIEVCFRRPPSAMRTTKDGENRDNLGLA
jgi:hypothetical protein